MGAVTDAAAKIGSLARGIPGVGEAVAGAIMPAAALNIEAIKAITPDDPTAAAPVAAPPPAPDITDQLVQRARLAAMRRAQMGTGLAQTFLTGPLGAPLPTGAPPASRGS